MDEQTQEEVRDAMGAFLEEFELAQRRANAKVAGEIVKAIIKSLPGGGMRASDESEWANVFDSVFGFLERSRKRTFDDFRARKLAELRSRNVEAA